MSEIQNLDLVESIFVLAPDTQVDMRKLWSIVDSRYSERDIAVMHRLFNENGKRTTLSMRAIGQEFEISSARVYQIKQKMVRHLRHPEVFKLYRPKVE